MKILIALFVIAVVMLLEGFGIWMLLGINEHEPTSRGRVFWLGVIVLTHWLGAAVYYAYRSLWPVHRPGPLSPGRMARFGNRLQPHTGRG